MTSVVHTDIKNIPEHHWNQWLEDGDVFHSHRFLLGMQRAKVENADMHFVCVYDTEQLIGTAVISTFQIDLSLFAGKDRTVQFIKRIFPSLFRTTICFCGLPLSVGQNSIRVKDEADLPLVMDKVQAHVERLSKRASVSVYKEFSLHKLDENLLPLGYLKLPSLPGCLMEITHRSSGAYLNSMRATYRRQIRSSWKKLESKKPVIVSDYFNQSPREKAPVFTILRGDDIPLEMFYEGYRKVMQRAEVRLETLNIDFFSTFFKEFNREAFALCMVFRGEIYGMFVCFEDAHQIRFLWTSIRDSRTDFDVYQNLLSCLVNYAIDQNVKVLDLGQTSYYPKMRMGGKTYPMHFYLKANNKWVHRLLKRYQASIFPKTPTPNLNVFREKIMAL